MSFINRFVKAFFEAVKTITAGLLGGALILVVIKDTQILASNGFVLFIIFILLSLTGIFAYSNYIIEKTEEVKPKKTKK